MTNKEKAREIAKSHCVNYPINKWCLISSDIECFASAIEMAKWKDDIMKDLVHKMKEYLIVEQGFDYDSSAMEHFEDYIGVEHELYNPFDNERR